jgi:hypothetical protein
MYYFMTCSISSFGSVELTINTNTNTVKNSFHFDGKIRGGGGSPFSRSGIHVYTYGIFIFVGLLTTLSAKNT